MIATKPINADLQEPEDDATTELPLATVDYSDIDEDSIPVLHEAVDAQGYSDADLGSDIDLAAEEPEAESADSAPQPTTPASKPTTPAPQAPQAPQATTEMNIDLGYAEADPAGNSRNQNRVELQPPRGLSQFIFNIASVQSGTPLEFTNPGTSALPAASKKETEKPMPVTHSPTDTTVPTVDHPHAAVIATKPEPHAATLHTDATMHSDSTMELEMAMMHRELNTPDPTLMVPRKENPFLPQHILNRLQGSSRNLVEEIAQSSAALEASTALLRNNKSRAARLAPAAQAVATDDKLTQKKQKMVDDLVDDYLPLIAAELRRRLRRMLEE